MVSPASLASPVSGYLAHAQYRHEYSLDVISRKPRLSVWNSPLWVVASEFLASYIEMCISSHVNVLRIAYSSDEWDKESVA